MLGTTVVMARHEAAVLCCKADSTELSGAVPKKTEKGGLVLVKVEGDVYDTGRGSRYEWLRQ